MLFVVPIKSVRHASHGFTLIEVLVTIVFLSVALVAVLGGIRSVKDTDFKAQNADLLQRLASEKMSDLNNLQDPTAGGTDGDFADRGYPDVAWTLQEDTTGVTDMSQITVTVTRAAQSQALTTLVYVRPQTTTTTTGTAAGAGA